MPTGYTAPITDGISFEMFVLRCARAFGALITMRDVPMDTEIPDEIKPSDYHKNALGKAQAELAKLKSLSLEDANEKALENYKKELDYYEKSIVDKRDLKDKYTAMLHKVEEWQPPTSDHLELKIFMKQQIMQSINHDCDMSFIAMPKLLIAHAWLENQIHKCLKDIKYHSDEMKEEVARCNSRTKWIRTLKKSLREVD